jgi:hypothetical protein
MKTIGPLEVLRSPPRETWRASWHRPGTARHGVWVYRWALATPWVTLRWLSAEFLATCGSSRRDEGEG